MSKEPVLLAGGSGYLGRYLRAELLNQGYPLRTVVRSPAGRLALFAGYTLLAPLLVLTFYLIKLVLAFAVRREEPLNPGTTPEEVR